MQAAESRALARSVRSCCTAWGIRDLAVSLLNTLPPSPGSRQGPRKVRGSVTKSGCCATRPFFASRKIGTRSVLAKSATFGYCAKRGLIFSWALSRALAALPTFQSNRDQVIAWVTYFTYPNESSGNRGCDESSGCSLRFFRLRELSASTDRVPKNCAAIFGRVAQQPVSGKILHPFVTLPVA